MAGATPKQTGAEEKAIRMADLLGGLSLSADLALGLPPEHTVRTCYIAMHTGRVLELSHREQAALYYATLLMDAGCTAWTSRIAAYVQGDEITARRELLFYKDQRNLLDIFDWMRRYLATGAPVQSRLRKVGDFILRGRQFLQEGFLNTCETARRFAQRLGMPEEVQQALFSAFEQWDGKGMPYGLQREAIPLISRIIHASSFIEVVHRAEGREATHEMARARRGSAFDPIVVDAFLSASAEVGFWEGLEQGNALSVVRAMEPDSPYAHVSEQRLWDVALFAADFSDAKSPYTVGHSRRVADTAKGIAERMGLPSKAIDDICMAALLRDLGLVAVPSFVLNRPPDTWARAEWEAFRLHPYHGTRVLSTIPALERVAVLVGAHHERLDGRGYPQGLVGAQVPLGARVVAIADLFHELVRDAPGRSALDPHEALQRLADEAGGALDAEAIKALSEELGASPMVIRENRTPAPLPAGLTRRELDVLRLTARGLTNKQIAQALLISEGTVRAHLEHIYTKVGVSSRTAAVMFAVENGLLP